eukprot:CAMPEP_0206242002 /NCGR_PEP_ID=MMETSP0047_2-20121206/16816_1 /ASSEMBLY_ACC=CAM_ASM_000192 /TAXON_ID=195065 /ORGANISM="Chroomonas mesostigmatica_cf, Strain CCMP1168" /LENGTH=275 /DNA_ID=CAMNT_0053666975 /DNA_START=12 /DNA_END=839 /DNA_ORIENTATION=-
MAFPDEEAAHRAADEGAAGSPEGAPKAGRSRRATAALIGASLLAVACMAVFDQRRAQPTALAADPLVAVEKRELAQSEEHAEGIDAALQRHQLSVQAGVRQRLAAKRVPVQQLAEGKPTQELSFWDLVNPTGQTGAPAPPVPASAQAEAVMSGGGTVDPEAMMDLEKGLKEHEQPGQGEQQQAASQGPAQSAAWDDSAEQASAGLELSEAGERARRAGGSQGFVTGSTLKVSADEYHQQMRTYMPSADGKLISPFKWFQAAGKPAAPSPKKEGRE